VPCHHIHLNAAGDTIEEMEAKGNESKMENLVKKWLRTQISQIEAQGGGGFWQNVD